MKIIALIAYSAAIVVANAVSIAAYETEILEIADEYGADIEEYNELSNMFEERVKKSCKPAVAKLQQCCSKAAGMDKKWQQSIMTVGWTARACAQKAKHQRQVDACVKPFMKLLEAKCPKETKKMLGNECKVYNEDEFDMDEFELLITNVKRKFDEDSDFEVNRDEDGVLHFEEKLRMTPPCKTAQMQLKQCADQHSKKDRLFRSTLQTAAKGERVCREAAVKKSQKKACEKQLKVILESKCPRQTRRVLRVCNKKTGELRATSLRE